MRNLMKHDRYGGENANLFAGGEEPMLVSACLVVWGQCFCIVEKWLKNN